MEPEQSKRQKTGGFLASLNRSFRMRPGAARKVPDIPLAGDLLRKVHTTGLENIAGEGQQLLRPLSHEIAAPRIDSYRFSMANLEDSQDVDLDAILGELCALTRGDDEKSAQPRRASQAVSVDRSVASSGFGRTHSRNCSDVTSVPSLHPNRTDSPDNDSAFSDTVSMLSSESSASSGASAGNKNRLLQLNLQPSKDSASQLKAEKIRLALEKITEANIKKLFIKAFSIDGSSKSLLVDEKMTCGYVARLLADKNHVTMEPKWALVEHLTDLYMERVYEDHEFLVENLMLWTRDSKNKIFFMERPDKISLFQTPEKYLIVDNEKGSQKIEDEHSRSVLIDEFFNQSINVQPPIMHSITAVPNYSGNAVPPLEGPLYLKSESKKGWKRHHFVMRSSGLYYYPKDKSKTLKELVCLTTFDVNDIYLGLNWKKKYKAPSDYCFAIKHPRLQQTKSVKFIKFLCAEDKETLEKWIVAMRIAKHGRQLLDNYRSLMDDLVQEDLDHLAEARSCSVASISQNSGNITPQQGLNSPDNVFKNQSIYSGGSIAGSSDISSGRHSCVSSSSSSGCMSDGPSECEGNAFDCEFPMGTIKRKPSMKPNIPLTTTTRQMKEMVDLATSPSHHSINSNSDHSSSSSLNTLNSSGYTNSGTLTRRHSRRKSNQASISDDGTNTGTLKKHINQRGSIESMSSSRNSNSGCNTPTLSLPKSESIFESQNGELKDTQTIDSLKLNNSSGNHNLPPFYKPYKGDLPKTGILLGYLTSQPVTNGVLPENQLVHSAIVHEKGAMKNNYNFSVSTEDLSDMPLPPPPDAMPYDSTIEHLRNKNLNLDPMFCSTFSLDSLPPPPPPIVDDANGLQGYDLTGSQLSLMSLPPPPVEVLPSEANLPKYSVANDNQFNNEVSRVSVSERVNQLASITQNAGPIRDPTCVNIGNSTNFSFIQQQMHKNPDILIKKPPVNGAYMNNNASNNVYGDIDHQVPPGNQIRLSQSSQNSGIYASCLAEMQLKTNQITSPIMLRKMSPSQTITDGTKSLGNMKSVSFDETTNTHYTDSGSPIMLRKPNNSTENSMVVPCSPNKKNKKITFSLPTYGDPPGSPPSLPNKPPPPKRNDNTRLSTSPKKLIDSTSNPPKDFLKDLQKVMKKKWQVAQKCKLEPTTTPHEVLGFREYSVLTEDYKETNVSNWVQEHYGHAGLYAPDNVYENVNKTQDDIVEYATSGHMDIINECSSPTSSLLHRSVDSRTSVSKKRPPPPPPKRSESTQLTTLPVQKLR